MATSAPFGSRPRAARLLGAALAALALALSGCGGSSSNALLQDVSIVLADYLIIDLNTGAIDARADVPDIATNSAYRTNKMVFKAIAAGSATLGQAAGTWCAQADETPSAANLQKYYIGVFEVTQAQWTLLAGTTPWNNVQPAAVVGGVTSSANWPAFNITHNVAAQALVNASAALHRTVALPTDAQWEYAARAGSTGFFPWGNSRSDLVAANYALVQETSAGHVGPDPVGSLLPNAFGIYDMIGNVWEMTSSGNLRGGSWSDTLAQARCANKNTLTATTAHAAVGLRLVLVP
jgi:formylglycine-generating enzyme required for sulfatase activity